MLRQWITIVSIVWASIFCFSAFAQPTHCAGLTPSPEQIESARRNTQDRGFLWRLTKDGRDSYLYGTLHIGRVEWLFPGPQMMQAWHNSELLAMELDLNDIAPIENEFNRQNSTSLTYYSADLLQKLARELVDKGCIPENKIASIPLAMQTLIALISQGYTAGLYPVYGQEIILRRLALRFQRPVIGLETIDLQVSTMTNTSPTSDQTLNILLEQIENGTIAKVLLRLSQAWEKSDLNDIANYPEWCNCLNTPKDYEDYKKLNDIRNPNMAEKITQLHNSGKKVFAAIGALHMTGPASLPVLLTERGFAVQRIH